MVTVDDRLRRWIPFSIELLVVIGIIGILSAIGVISFGKVREKARRSACIATLRSNFNSDENLVAYWNFDEGAGTTAKDFWGNNGTINGAGDAYVSDSIIDTALNLDFPHYITVPDSQSLSPSQAISIETWIKTTWEGTGYIIYKIDASPYPGFSLYKVAQSDFIFLAGGSGNANLWMYCDKNIADGKWHHLAGTAEMGGERKIYFDGQSCGTPIATGNQGFNSNQTLYIGGAGVNSFNGILDEPIIYNRALSADEIASHYKACKK